MSSRSSGDLARVLGDLDPTVLGLLATTAPKATKPTPAPTAAVSPLIASAIRAAAAKVSDAQAAPHQPVGEKVPCVTCGRVGTTTVRGGLRIRLGVLEVYGEIEHKF